MNKSNRSWKGESERSEHEWWKSRSEATAFVGIGCNPPKKATQMWWTISDGELTFLMTWQLANWSSFQKLSMTDISGLATKAGKYLWIWSWQEAGMQLTRWSLPKIHVATTGKETSCGSMLKIVRCQPGRDKPFHADRQRFLADISLVKFLPAQKLRSWCFEETGKNVGMQDAFIKHGCFYMELNGDKWGFCDWVLFVEVTSLWASKTQEHLARMWYGLCIKASVTVTCLLHSWLKGIFDAGAGLCNM